ncbi:MAG: lytic murein transglycosylase [Xanthobacteraceae bacterium]|nr:lytic murein transglycosylase [Xanthobacteraceae bacterium]
MLRHLSVLTLAIALGILPGRAAAEGSSRPDKPNFNFFLQALWPEAEARGIARATFDAAFAGLVPDARVISATRGQPEYGKPIGAYINSVASQARIEAGIRKASQWAEALAAVEQKFGVDRWIILSIWGIETSYGGDKDRWDVIRSLATLAKARYREPYFRNELLAALVILQQGHISRDRMLGSWAGAMGQPQFMPSSFMDYAVDFSGDGRRDIWTNVPDVLASMANYFRQQGWRPGSAWGFEVAVPKDFDYRSSRASFQDWAKLGVRRADGGALPDTGDAILFFPSGASGPAFLVTENFVVIKRYNNSDAYALAVAQLADRMRGLSPIRAAWPRDDRQLSREQRIALQRKLAELGYHVRDFDGRIDFDLRDSIRDVQVKFGMLADGHPTTALMDRLGARTR